MYVRHRHTLAVSREPSVGHLSQGGGAFAQVQLLASVPKWLPGQTWLVSCQGVALH